MSVETAEPVTEIQLSATGSGHTVTGKGKIPIYACSNITKKNIEGGGTLTLIDILPSGIDSNKINLLLITSTKHSDDCYKICYVPYDEANNSQQDQQQQQQTQQHQHQQQQTQQHQHQYVCSVCNKPKEQQQHQHQYVCCECNKPKPQQQTCECCGKPNPQQQTCECDYEPPTNPCGPTNGSGSPTDEKPPEDCLDLISDHLYCGPSMVKLLSKGKKFSKLKVWNQYPKRETVDLTIFCCFAL